MSAGSFGGIVPECEAWVTLREINGDPLQPRWVETRIWGDTPDDIWKQVHEFEEQGYAVWGLRGTNGRF